MDLIMQSKDHHVVLLDECQLLLVDRIVGKKRSVVAMIVESWFVRDYQVQSAPVRFSQNVHRVQERRSNPGHGRGGVSGLYGVHRVGNRSRIPLLDTVNHIGSCGCLSGSAAREQHGTKEDHRQAHLWIMSEATAERNASETQ